MVVGANLAPNIHNKFLSELNYVQISLAFKSFLCRFMSKGRIRYPF